MSRARRRVFLAAAATVPLLPEALAQPVPVPSPAPPPAAAGGGTVADTLAAAVRQRWGAVIDEAWMPDIRTALEGNLKASDQLRKLKLTNADEPVAVFEARPPQPRKTR